MEQRRPSVVQRGYRALLRLLPGDFRAEFGHEMEGVFLDEHVRAAHASSIGGRIRLWLRTAAGIAREAPSQHADVLRQDLAYPRWRCSASASGWHWSLRWAARSHRSWSL